MRRILTTFVVFSLITGSICKAELALEGIHANPTPPFPVLGDGHHYSWFGLDEDLGTPGITDVSYSFTWTASVIGFFGGGDMSTADQKARVADAFASWEAGTPGLKFFEKVGVTATISVGTAASFATTGSAAALGLGGGLGTHHTATHHHLTNALAVQRGTVSWHNGAGSPAGTGKYDYLTVAAQEIGHAFGLGHNAGDTTSVMYPSLGLNTRRTPNGSDFASSTFLYPTPIPEPSSIVLMAMGGLGLAGYSWRRRRKDP